MNSTEFSLKIKMDKYTYEKLRANDRNLVILKAVQSSSGETSGARPLAWICLASHSYGFETIIKWTESYEAYTSTDEIFGGSQISASNSYPLELGQSLTITNPNGAGEVQSNGIPGSVFISNPNNRQQGEPQLTCGLKQTCEDIERGRVSSQLCAFPLLPKSAEIIAPINKIFVNFTSRIKKVGEVAEYTIHPGIMLDYQSEMSREIRFDIDKGYIPDHPEGSEIIEPTPDLPKRLIIQSSPYEMKMSDFVTEDRQKEYEKTKNEEIKNLEAGI